MTIKSLSDVRPGDIMISGMNTAPNRILVYGGQLLMRDHFRMGKFVAGHAGVVTFGGKLVEAMPSGARERDLRDDDWSESHAYFRPSEDYFSQHRDAAKIAQYMVGTPYSFMSYAYLGAFLAGWDSRALGQRINRRHGPIVIPGATPMRSIMLPHEAICSVLADQAWSLTGKTLIVGTHPQVVTPGMLTQHLWSTCAIRGGAGIF